MNRKIIVYALLPVLILSGCTAYRTQYVGFRPPEAYPNFVMIEGLKIGCEAFAGRDKAEKAFGFDIKGAGLLPVQVVMDNKSNRSIEIAPSQTFLIDDENRYWNIIPTQVAIRRLADSSQLASFVGKGAGRGAVLGAIAGTIIATAFGIVSGRSIGEAAIRGGAVGAAGGAIIGGAQEAGSPEREYSITEDLRSKSLEGKQIPNGSLANGFIFFPGEARTAKELRLQYRETETGRVHTVNLRLQPVTP